MKHWLRDPIWIFLVLGIAIFWLDSLANSDANTITVSASDKSRLSAQWLAQTGREPTPQELTGLIDQFIEEEVYYREALALGLDTNDTIIRRRLVQKLVFLTEDIATSGEPSQAQLEDFFADNKEDYKVAKRYSFKHIYFSRDRREDALADATQELEQARIESRDPVGDPFILQSAFAQRTQRDMAGTFGSKFASSLDALPLEAWSSPVESAYGWHLINVQAAEPAFIPTFDELQKRLRNDYQSKQRAHANNAYKAQLLEKYTTVDAS